MKNLIFIHGALGTSELWEPSIKLFSNEYQIHNINLPGHGKSTETITFASIDFFSEYISNYIQKKQLHSYSIIGYSMGGYIALNLAIQKPIGLNSVFTVATKMLWNPEISASAANGLDIQMLSEKAPKFIENIKQMHGLNFPDIMHHTQQILISIGKKPISHSDLNNIEIPVQMNVGTKDLMVTINETQEAVQQLKKGSIRLLEEQPHPLERMNPELLSNEIQNFIQ